jgi:multidrug efflux system outer membrane protein
MQLLGRRPDIRAAERRLAAATARIGVQVADLYPHVTFGGQAGFTGPSLGNLFAGGPFRWLAGPLISWIFTDRTAVRARIQAAEATAQAALAQFDGTILTALRETETALSAYRNELDRRTALAAARDAAARAAELERLRVRAGRTDSLALLDTERTLAAAEAALADSDARLVSDQIDLFRALGGGWQTADRETA